MVKKFNHDLKNLNSGVSIVDSRIAAYDFRSLVGPGEFLTGWDS